MAAAVALAQRRCFLELRQSLKASAQGLALSVAVQRSVLQAFDASPFVGGSRADVLLPCRGTLERVGAELLAEGADVAAAASIVDSLAEAAAAGAASMEMAFIGGGAATVERASKEAVVASFGGASFAIDKKRVAWLKTQHTGRRSDFDADLFDLLCRKRRLLNFFCERAR